jgi:hypothetical protein
MLPEHWQSVLAENKDSAYLLGEDLNLLYTNSGWDVFAQANGGGGLSSWTPGLNILESCSEPTLLAFYSDLYKTCLDSEHDALHPVQHSYECSSPTKLRKFRMSLYRLEDPARILVVHAKTLEVPIESTERVHANAADLSKIESDGTVRQCAHCRCVQSASDPARWLWVPQFVEKSPANTSHTFCSVCFEYYYPEEGD